MQAESGRCIFTDVFVQAVLNWTELIGGGWVWTITAGAASVNFHFRDGRVLLILPLLCVSAATYMDRTARLD